MFQHLQHKNFSLRFLSNLEMSMYIRPSDRFLKILRKAASWLTWETPMFHRYRIYGTKLKIRDVKSNHSSESKRWPTLEWTLRKWCIYTVLKIQRRLKSKFKSKHWWKHCLWRRYGMSLMLDTILFFIYLQGVRTFKEKTVRNSQISLKRHFLVIIRSIMALLKC